MKAIRLFMVWCALMLAASSFAQVKCKMPNGVVVTRSMGSCPIDALEAYTLDGQPLPKPSESPQAQAAKQEKEQLRAQRESAERARMKAELDAKLKEQQEEARQKRAQAAARKLARFEAINTQACYALVMQPFECTTEASALRGNFVVVSTHLLTRDLHANCRRYAYAIRKQLLEDEPGASNWSVRIKYSPTGATVSECPI